MYTLGGEYVAVESWGWRVSENHKTVLVVDDDESMVRALSIKLRDAGYTVFVAMDALQAVTQAQKREPDLVILDVRMPAGGGINVMDKLSHSIKTRRIPVIVMTALEDPEIQEQANSFGVLSQFFKKPFDTTRMLEAVARALP